MTNVEVQLVAFGREVRRIREDVGLTQEQLAKLSGRSSIYIGTVENGRRDPSLSTVYALAKGLGVQASAFFGANRPLASAGEETAALFDTTPPDVQNAVLTLLRAVLRHRQSSTP